MIFRAEVFAFMQTAIVALIVVNAFLGACVVVLARELRREMKAYRPSEEERFNCDTRSPPSLWRRAVFAWRHYWGV